MERIRLGRTGLMVSKVGFGGVPIQRVNDDEAAAILGRCLDLGITFFDTAAEYSNSEERIGRAIRGRRDEVVIATKSNYGTPAEVEANIRRSLARLGTDFVDLFQFHGVNNFDVYRKVLDPAGPIGTVQRAKEAGLVRHIGLTSHSVAVAREAVKSGLFETIMVPFNFVTCEPADELLPLARQHDVGFIAMKPLAGGIVPDIRVAFRYLFQFPDVVSIPGVKELHEMDEIVALLKEKEMTGEEQLEMERLRAELDRELCRRCGCCEPCPQGVPVLQMVDLVPFIKNQALPTVFADGIVEKVAKIADCTKCGDCEEKCPYRLPVMQLIEEHASLYQMERGKYLKRQASR